MANKQNKVFFGQGLAWFFDQFGNRKSIASLDEANTLQSSCCGLDCCNNRITLPINDGGGTTTYPSFFEFIKNGDVVTMRITFTNSLGVSETREILIPQ